MDFTFQYYTTTQKGTTQQKNTTQESSHFATLNACMTTAWVHRKLETIFVKRVNDV
jgi:hypothetical protein